MTAHEKLEEYPYSQPDVTASHKPGISSAAKAVVDEIDSENLQSFLLKLADTYLGMSGRSKKMFLAFPICCYAKESLMVELTKRAPNWKSTALGNDAPPLYTFRKANAYSETRAAMLFADKYHELDEYAKVRGADADFIRDNYLSNIGVDAQGRKVYELGNQTVTACLQSDLTFIVELENGKIAKSLPKKGAVPSKYEAASADFSEMKKSARKIVKNRVDNLFADFLSGRARDAESWCGSYLNNPLLRAVAKLLVWAQNEDTFSIGENGPVLADGTSYVIKKNEKIILAHPMEMKAADIKAWQKFFTANWLKQPFEQIWEPVADATDITADRYADCMIPFYRFNGQEKHGITIEDENFHSIINIYLKSCKSDIVRIDKRRHEILPEDRFQIRSFSYKEFNRQVNHIVTFFDRMVIYDRIKNNDITMGQYLSSFTLAQITKFIKVATENNCANATAVLLEHKNNNFADFDPMEEFSLDI